MIDLETDSVLVLPKERCLPVVQGLMALLLGMDFTCNVDLFLVTCKVRKHFMLCCSVERRFRYGHGASTIQGKLSVLI